MSVLVHAVGRPEVAPCAMPDRFRHDVTYFCTPPGSLGAPARLPPAEYFITREDARRILDDGVVRIVSPLDSASSTEIEITEEQEAFLDWLFAHDVQHVRIA